MHWTKVDNLYTTLRREVRSRRDWRHGPNRVHEVAKEGFDAVKPHVPFVGQRFCDLGCGIFHPFGISTAMFLNGAGATIGLDLHPSDPRRAAEALADLLMECLAFPERWHWSEIPRSDFIERIRRFNLAALMEGDLRKGLADLPLRHCVTDIHSPALPEGSIDVMTSRAVLEHFLDFGRAVERFYALLSPGGIAAHGIDLVDHRAYEGPGHHFWSFLAEGDDWSDGVVNRLRSGEIRAHFERVGFEILHYKNVHGTMPAGFLAQVKGRFATMSAEELSVTGVHCVLRRPLNGPRRRSPLNEAESPVAAPAPAPFAGPAEPQPAVPASLPTVGAAASGPRSERPHRVADVSFLSQIPSETTLGERTYLFDLFANQWDGIGTVVEIGPFLGGTTRAIAAGMAANPRLAADAALHTFDRFDDYYSPEQLRSTIDPMVRGGTFTAGQADALCRGADFERLFSAIHSPHEYGRLVHLHNSPLPDRPEEVEGSVALDCLVDQGELGALFIDGCKSWASTHYAMKFLLPRLRPGAPVIFEDFGWYTCFWISAAAHALREFLTPESHVECTYTFRLTRPVTANAVAKRLALTPVEMGETFFAKAAVALFERSRREGDLRGELIAQLHHVAALLTIGRRGAAADVLKGLEVKRYAAFAAMIRGCIKSPTYLPGGKQILWKEAA